MLALARIAAAMAVLLAADVCHAQNAAPGASPYPTRPIRLVAPFAPGGPVDVGARLLAPKLQEALGVQVYVENVPGGSGNIGTALVAKAAPDGATVLVISSSFVVNPSMFKLTYDIDKDLAAVSLVGVAPQVDPGASVGARDQHERVHRAGEGESRQVLVRLCCARLAGLPRRRSCSTRPSGSTCSTFRSPAADRP